MNWRGQPQWSPEDMAQSRWCQGGTNWSLHPCFGSVTLRWYVIELDVLKSLITWSFRIQALNDYIFGPTFNDLSAIMSVPFEKITYFAIIRQCAYTMGSVGECFIQFKSHRFSFINAQGGIAFDYVNRQVSLTMLLFLSAVTLFLTPYVPSIGLFYIIAILNGFSAGACDVGFHVWILEMFQNGGGPLLQALHFSFGKYFHPSA